MRLLLSALAACLLVAWLLWPQEGEPPPAPAQADRAGVGSARPPLLVAKGFAPVPRGESEVARALHPQGRYLPEDPPERGTSALTVHLVSARDDRPVDTRVALWRIAEPGNAYYDAGDRQLAQGYSEDGRCTFERLAEGTYRIFAHAVRAGGEDPPPFEVRGAHAEIHLRLDGPYRFPVYLRVLDEAGRLVEEGWKRLAGAQRAGAQYSSPRWMVARRLRARPPRDTRLAMLHGSTHDVFGSRPPRQKRASRERKPVLSTTRGFEVSQEEEPPREGGWITSWEVGYGTHGRVDLLAQPPPGRTLTYVAPALSRDAVQEMVFLPDGRRAAEVGAEFDVVSKAVELPEDGEGPDVRALALDIVVRLKGYRRLLVTYRQRDPLPRWVLEPR